MRTYYVQTYVYHPYKIESNQTVKASSISLTIIGPFSLSRGQLTDSTYLIIVRNE